MTKTETAKRAVRVWLADHGKNQMWLAKRIGVHHSQLSKVLNGHEQSEPVWDGITRVTGISLTAKEVVEANR